MRASELFSFADRVGARHLAGFAVGEFEDEPATEVDSGAGATAEDPADVVEGIE